LPFSVGPAASSKLQPDSRSHSVHRRARSASLSRVERARCVGRGARSCQKSPVDVPGSGAVASQTTPVPSGAGRTRDITFDPNGDGIIDRQQPDVTTGDGVSTDKVQTITNTNAAGVLLDTTGGTTATTGEIEYVRSVEARATNKGVGVSLHRGGFGGSLAKEENTPVGKAIRAIVIEISDYLKCAMVDQGGCMAEYDAKEEGRRQRTKDSIKLD